MAFDSVGDTLIVTVGCVLFAVHLAKVTRDLLSPEWRKGACEALANLPQLLRSRLWARGAADEITEEVASRLLAWQLGQFQFVLRVGLFTITLMAAVIFCKVVLGFHRMHTTAQDVIMLLSYMVLLLADWCPWLVNKRSLDAWYSFLMCCLALYMIPPFCASGHLLGAVLVTKMLGAALSLGRMNLSAVFFWGVVHMAFEFWTHSVLGQSLGKNFAWVWPLMLSLLISKIEMHKESELRKDIKAKVMQDRQSAGDALSAMFYDVVVELDHHLCIAAPAPKLTAFLLRSTPVPLERTPFEDLLQDEGDRERFRNLLCPAGPLPASSFVELAHARMRGGSDTVFQVELFGYRFRGPGGHQRYLVGIREAGDFERGGMPMANSGPQPVAMPPLDEVVAVVDPYRPKLPILSHTPFFSIRIMPVAERTCLMPAVVKGAKFEAWVQKAVNWHRFASLDEQEPGDRPEESFVVTFKPRSRNIPMCTRALCRLKIKYSDSSSGESSGSGSRRRSWDGELRVELAFSHIVQVPRCLERADGGSSSSSSSSRSHSTGTPSSRPRMSLGGGRQSGQAAILGARTSL